MTELRELVKIWVTTLRPNWKAWDELLKTTKGDSEDESLSKRFRILEEAEQQKINGEINAREYVVLCYLLALSMGQTLEYLLELYKKSRKNKSENFNEIKKALPKISTETGINTTLLENFLINNYKVSETSTKSLQAKIMAVKENPNLSNLQQFFNVQYKTLSKAVSKIKEKDRSLSYREALIKALIKKIPGTKFGHDQTKPPLRGLTPENIEDQLEKIGITRNFTPRTEESIYLLSNEKLYHIPIIQLEPILHSAIEEDIPIDLSEFRPLKQAPKIITKEGKTFHYPQGVSIYRETPITRLFKIDNPSREDLQSYLEDIHRINYPCFVLKENQKDCSLYHYKDGDWFLEAEKRIDKEWIRSEYKLMGNDKKDLNRFRITELHSMKLFGTNLRRITEAERHVIFFSSREKTRPCN